MAGFVKIDRDLTSWQWYKEPLTVMLYIHLIITANWRDDNFKGVEVKRGERVVSYASLANETGMSVQNVRTAISHIISTGEITKRQCGKYTVILVKNYDSFQTNNKVFNKKSDNISNSKSTTNEEYKNIKEIKEEEEEKKAQIRNSKVQSLNNSSSSSVEDIISLYCEICKSLPPPDLSPETETNIQRAINFHGIGKIKSAFSTVETTPFLRGDVKNWYADINWIFAGTNIDKILSGKYREYRERSSRSREVSDSYGIANLEEYKEFINNF